MSNNYADKYTTVVMDGSHDDVVRHIIEIIDDLTKQEFGKSTCGPLDSDHPTMMVIRTKTRPSAYRVIQYIVELRYPGLCVFNPPM